ncbi:histidine kinase [Chryseobacterium formosus]|uniref:Histidine kinase n=1 Tax=Chryseobacterium formosus TaxID=1537363 RepID=A0ABT3XXV5_9FLAO|nr:histidine kinase [Chryseobacterium formosus]MCX8526449.1 histidine kinase [Chryseobacterium formosus]
MEQIALKGYSKRFTDTANGRKILQAALLKANSSGTITDQTICYSYLALYNKRFGNLSKFNKYSQLAYDTSKKTNDELARAYANFTMGYLHSYVDDSSAAIMFFLQSLKDFDKLKKYSQCARISSDISYLFSSGSIAKQKKYSYQALSYAEKTGNVDDILHARLAVGGYLIDLYTKNKEDTALQTKVLSFMKTTSDFADQNKDKIEIKSNIAISHINLASLYMKSPKFYRDDIFLQELDKASYIGEKYGLKTVYRSVFGLKGQYYLKKGEQDKAEQLFKDGIAYQESIAFKDHYILAAFYESLKNLAVKRNDYKEYYQYDIQYDKYKALEFDEKSQRLLQNADVKFETEKKTQKILSLEYENRLQEQNRYLSYGASFVLLLCCISLLFIYYYRNRYFKKEADHLRQAQSVTNLQLQLKEKETLENLLEKISIERKLLQAQMDPHFIFNILGNIQSFILREDRETAVFYLNKFAKLTRKILEQSRKEYVELHDEIAILKNYIDLQQLRLNKSFDYEILLDSDIHSDEQIPPFMIQPFVENAIEHGLKALDKARKGKLTIFFSKNSKEDVLICTISDNGIGEKTDGFNQKDPHHISLATKITDERLKLLFGDNYSNSLSIIYGTEENPNIGCTVIIKIPFN